jgi:phosphoribosylamine--glycine ligase
MRTLVVGSGAREHALAWKLSQDSEIVCAPGNPGIEQIVETVPIPTTDFESLIALAKEREIDLAVVGPEDPLIAGLSDRLRDAGISTFGPGAAGAKLEGSKGFSKSIMTEAGIPTASFRSFERYESAQTYLREQFGSGIRQVVKANGAALGRGVVVPEDLHEAEEALRRMMVEGQFGDAGRNVVIEDRLEGREFSLLTIVGDRNFVSLPIAQDHKRALDGDQGPNTGGMGAFSPCDWASATLIEEVEQAMVAPLVRSLNQSGIPFRGTLFTGVMVTPQGPKCLEYNVRFGDPEIQTLVVRLGSGFLEALVSAANGGFVESPNVLPQAAVTVVAASDGYPVAYRKGLPIELGPIPESVVLFFAGVGEEDGRLVTSGGRVIAATAVGPDIASARRDAYLAAENIRFEGRYFRSDIAK